MKAKNQNSLGEWVRWQGIGWGLKALALVLRRQGKKDEWLGRALREFEGVYQFESGDQKFARYLILQKGRVFAAKNWAGAPDFKLTFYEPAKMRLRGRLEIIIGNKIGHSGNLYYIYQFGFIMSLLERRFRRKKWEWRMRLERAG